MKNHRITGRLLATCAAISVSAPSLAQDGGAALSQDEQASNAIIVTAQRREQDVMDVPVSVTVLSAETLTDRGISVNGGAKVGHSAA